MNNFQYKKKYLIAPILFLLSLIALGVVLGRIIFDDNFNLPRSEPSYIEPIVYEMVKYKNEENHGGHHEFS